MKLVFIIPIVKTIISFRGLANFTNQKIKYLEHIQFFLQNKFVKKLKIQSQTNKYLPINQLVCY